MDASSTVDVRRIAAALANAEARIAYAEIVLSGESAGASRSPSGAKRQRTLDVLVGSGLIEQTTDDHYAATDAPFRAVLAQQGKREAATGVDRFLRAGRIDHFPASATDRRALLEWVLDQVVASDEVLTERELNERLLAYCDDFALLRRYLVDNDLLKRTPSGSSYAR
jgi:hypothetical protein